MDSKTFAQDSIEKREHDRLPTDNSTGAGDRSGFQSWDNKVCRKCAVRFEPQCAKSSFFGTSHECFRAGVC